MKIFWPFSTDRRAGEAGNILLLTGMLATATAVAGGKVMLDRTLAQRKASQLAENTKRAKEIPGSAAMIAKALISLPPRVASSKSEMWTTDCVLEHHKKPTHLATNCVVKAPPNIQILPLIYPIPYVSGAPGSPAQPATKVDKTVDPPTGANWGMFVSEGSSATVKVFTNDSSRTATQDVSSAINSKAVVSGNDTLKRTESLVTYSFRNCDSDGNAKPSFTGRYCARAEILSQNYASAVKVGKTQADDDKSVAVSKAVAELGVIEPPPAPTCGAISTPGNVKVTPGDPFSLNVNATGVALGYQVKYGDIVLTRLPQPDQSLVSLPWNNPTTSALHTITGIPTDPPGKPEVKSALNALIKSGVNQAEFTVVLQGVVSSTSCPVVVTLPGPVSCVPNSFTVTRIGDDLRTCQMSLQKDSGAGTITGITVGGQTFTGPAAGFSGSSWTGTMPCTEDAQTLTATLTRSVFGAVSMSICSPNRTVSELAADCVASSLDGGRDPNNLLRCNISLKRDQKSHSQVTVNTTPGLLAGSGSWGSSQNNDNSWTWQGVIDPCPFGSVTVTASLMRGSTPDSCGTKTITSLEPAKCNGPPTGGRNPYNSAECKISVNKFTSSGPIKHVIINETNEPSSGNHPSPGAWGTSDSWTSPWFGCPLTATDYNLSLVGLDDAPSSCGRFTMPANSYKLTTTVSGDGSISRSPDTATYNHGSTVTLTATPLVGHSFVNWGGACSGATNTCTLTMDSDKTVTANFIATTYSLTTSVNGSGSISRSPDTATYNHGKTVTLTATPTAGYKFDSWGGACAGTSTTCTVTMDGNKSVMGNFEQEWPPVANCGCTDQNFARIRNNESCPDGYAILFRDDPMVTNSSWPSMGCCRLPMPDVLVGPKIVRDTRCQANEIIVGAKKTNREIYCRAIDTSKYALSSKKDEACYYGSGAGGGAGSKACLKSAVPQDYKNRLNTHFGSDACVNMPFGAVSVGKDGRACGSEETAQLLNKADNLPLICK